MTEDRTESELPLLRGSAQSNETVLPLRCSPSPANSLQNVPDACLLKTEEERFRYEIRPFRGKRFDLLLSDKLPLDDLKKLREWLLLQICNTSDLLVELLQDRQRLSEEVHVRLISIEQLHRLLEARCYFGGLSTGLFS